jgi:DNA-binding HxlR family transcriptional regulator
MSLRMLTQQTRELEDANIVHPTVHFQVSPKSSVFAE